MHLVIPTYLSLFWVVCHPSKTFPLKKFEQEPQHRLSPSPHLQTILFLTSDPWSTTPILARYKLVVSKLCACSTSMCVHGLSTIHAFAMTYGLVCTFFYSFFTFCGVNESLSFLLYVLLLSWVGSCLVVGLFFSNPFLTLFCKLVNTFAMPSYCSYHAII